MDFTVPSETRSSTDSEGGSSGDKDGLHPTEDPSNDYEKTIQSVSVFFFKPTASGTGWELIEKAEKVTFANNKITIETTPDFVKNLADVGKISVRVLLNQAAGVNAGDNDKFSLTGIDVAPLGDYGNPQNYLPLSNIEEFVVDFSGLQKTDRSEFIKNLFGIIGTDRTIDLSKSVLTNGVTPPEEMNFERSVARIDFKPNHGKETNGNPLPDNVYQIAEIPNLYAKMQSLQVFNVSKSSYSFRHTSPGNSIEASLTGIEPFGKENYNEKFGEVDDDLNPIPGSNIYKWMADCDWETKQTNYSKGPTTNDYFLNQPVTNNGIYYLPTTYTKGILDLTAKDAEGNLKYEDGAWTKWCYISENTLPSTAAMTKGFCSGIAFNMYLCQKNGMPLGEDDFVTYDEYYQNIADYEAAYKEWAKNKAEAEANGEEFDEEEPENPNDDKIIGQIANTTFGNTGLYKVTIGTQDLYCRKISVTMPDPNHKVVGDQEIQTITKDAYVVTYYYFIQHNVLDKEKHVLGIADPMQYAVVRNNIYKISVTSLNRLPEPFKPDVPAEPTENYISVETQILSWARVDKEVEL